MDIRRYRRRNKYGNIKCHLDGHDFDSRKEANRYAELSLMQKAGVIKNLELQKPFVLQEGFRDRDGKWQRPVKYVADFVYTDTATGEQVIEDVKSPGTRENAVYKLKRKLMMGKGYYITEV